MRKRILLMNDMPGYGKIALAAAGPVLSYMGYDTFCLPTALVSNPLNYGTFTIRETTDYMRESIQAWQKLGFSFDAVLTGFLASKDQAAFLADFLEEQSRKGSLIFADPIMGDNGRLYNSIDRERIQIMRRIVSKADYIVPNYTESCCLAGVDWQEGGQSRADFYRLIDLLREQGAKSVVITSAMICGERAKPYRAVAGFDHRNGEYFMIPVEEVEGQFPGTGDIFAAILAGEVLADQSLKEAAQRAMDAIRRMLLKNQEQVNALTAVPIESCLELI